VGAPEPRIRLWRRRQQRFRSQASGHASGWSALVQASSEIFGRDPVVGGGGGMTTPQVMIIFIAASTVI
jgi:hypothetical protein